MAKLATRYISWLVVASAVAYRVRCVPHDTPSDSGIYDKPYAEILNPTEVDGRIRENLADLEVTPSVSGTYDIYVSAVDEAGNEGDFAILDDAVLDFEAPEAPKDLQLE